jgi:hypothetical protein
MQNFNTFLPFIVFSMYAERNFLNKKMTEIGKLFCDYAKSVLSWSENALKVFNHIWKMHTKFCKCTLR